MSSQVEEELEVAKPTKASAIREDMLETVLIANLFLLFLAGFETSSSMMTACIFFLARNQDVQERLFNEINDADFNEKMDYNTLMSLQYLDMVVYETMRHFPIVEIERTCTRDYEVPGTGFTVPKGMIVQVSAPGVMMDERYYPNPTEFNPENFSKESKDKRNPAAFMAFGIGPRNCIGSRLALFNMKSGLVHLVSEFRVLTCSKTPEKLIMEPSSQNQDVKGGIWVKFEKRN